MFIAKMLRAIGRGHDEHAARELSKAIEHLPETDAPIDSIVQDRDARLVPIKTLVRMERTIVDRSRPEIPRANVTGCLVLQPSTLG